MPSKGLEISRRRLLSHSEKARKKDRKILDSHNKTLAKKIYL
jgi:hypothetical protein